MAEKATRNQSHPRDQMADNDTELPEPEHVAAKLLTSTNYRSRESIASLFRQSTISQYIKICYIQ